MDTSNESERPPSANEDSRSILTPLERDLVQALSAGRTYRETARAMRITPREVESLVAAVFRKLDLGGTGLAGVREPRRPGPSDGSGQVTAEEPNR